MSDEPTISDIADFVFDPYESASAMKRRRKKARKLLKDCLEFVEYNNAIDGEPESHHRFYGLADRLREVLKTEQN